MSSASGTVELELLIQGMTCAACAVRIEKKLSRLDLVSATVNFATERAAVTAGPGTAIPEIIDVIKAAGYTATVLRGSAPARPASSGTVAGDTPAGDTAQEVAEPGGGQAAYLRRRLIISLLFFVPLSDLSIQFSLFPLFRFPGWQWVLVGLAVPVALWAAWPFHRAALRNARHGSCSMDTLVSLGIVAACGWSVYAMFFLDRDGPGSATQATALHELLHGSGGGIYLEVAAAVTTFLLAGRFFEARARRLAGEAMRELASAGPREACVLAADGSERRIPVAALRLGDMVVVRPGEKIAADGVVLFGDCAIDASMMTGESVPAEVTVGDDVTGGTIALTGRLVIRADRVGQDTQLARLIRLVEQAQADKAAVQRLADRVSGVFVPCVLVFAAATLGGWLLAGSSAAHAFSASLAVLIIACPCALGLATPAALMVACGRGAQLGIFIKGYPALESARAIDTVVLDKTGTVTTGQLTVTGVRAATGTDQAELLRLAGAVELASEHPVACAISQAARGDGAPPLPLVQDFRALPGLGARGMLGGREVIVGRARLLRDRGLVIPAELTGQCIDWERAGHTAVLAGWDGQARGVVAVADTIRPSAAAAVTRLRRLGLSPVLLTGDNEVTARTVAAAVGIDEVIAEVLPAGKAAYIKSLRASGRSVAMVGDGVNDGPAIAGATLGIAIGSGTDAAIGAADLIVLRDDLCIVPEAITLARATFTTIRRNLGWAFGYNLAAIPLAAAGFLNPLVAAATMTFSSVFVVWNSLRLRHFQAGDSRLAPQPASGLAATAAGLAAIQEGTS